MRVLKCLPVAKRAGGWPAGAFEPDSINDRVQKRLTTLAERLRDFTKGEEKTG